MVERENKRTFRKLCVIGLSAAILVPTVAGGVYRILEKEISPSKFYERIISRLENVTSERAERSYNRWKIDVVVKRRTLSERFEDIFTPNY